ncbi:MAG: conjugal transfer protein, partial [Solirubrobacteraceae bacterium]
PGRREQHARELARFMAPELAAAAMPEVVRRGEQEVGGAVPAGSTRLDADRALVTVAVGLARDSGVRYLAVPVGRDERGGLVVYDLPSFVPAPARGIVELPESEPLPADERAELEGVLTRFLRSFLAGDSAGLEYLVLAGERVRAVSPPMELVDVDGIALLAGDGDRRAVAVELRARDASSGAVFRLRYRVALVRAGRWFVASVNASPEGRLR